VSDGTLTETVVATAREWTQALARWCDNQSGMVPYRGACTVHRAELLQFEGSWPQAEAASGWCSPSFTRIIRASTRARVDRDQAAKT